MSAASTSSFLRRTLDALLILVALNCIYGVFQLGVHLHARTGLEQTRQQLEAENHDLSDRLGKLTSPTEKRP
jgi:hypothetical protein